MALPKIDVPIYTVDLPLSKKSVRYRPFLVKEEKILLMAMESNDEKEILESIKQIINNCCLDDIDVETLPVLDVEYFFLNLRARSINEISELQYKCNNLVKDDKGEEKECGNVVKMKLNILDVKPEFNEKHSNKIELSKNLGIVMKYPNIKMVTNVNDENDVEKIIKIVSNCVEYIYDENNIYYKKDIDETELIEFIESMNKEQFSKIQDFFNTIPKLKKDMNFKCGKCGYSEKIEVEGIQNFFV
jgi:rubrerythrin